MKLYVFIQYKDGKCTGQAVAYAYVEGEAKFFIDSMYPGYAHAFYGVAS